ncbi:MAG: FecR family protein [Cyanobacteria bacterium P01_F01_bin.13]
MEKLNVIAPGRWLSLVCASLGMLLSMPRSAIAQSDLTWARVELTRNQVNLYTNGQSRRARVSDVLGINDALSTARRARAELRFNDGSLARIGESAVFRFTPNTRNFRLSNGTVLLLIPPGQGRTTIQTPNAVTGIHGSALFVRFVPETDTTIIGALTNNADGPMMAFNQDGSLQHPLYAGEMVVLRGDNTLEHFLFDLPHFLATSDLLTGLGIEDLKTSTGDAAIDAVRQEIREALEQQQQFENGDDVVENPAFLSASIGKPLASEQTIPDFALSPAADFLQQNGLSEEFENIFNARSSQAPPSQVQQTQRASRVPPAAPSPVVEQRPQPVVETPTNPPAQIAGPTPGPAAPTPTPEVAIPSEPSDPVAPPTAPEPPTPEPPITTPIEPVIVEQPGSEPVEPPEVVVVPEPTIPPNEVGNPTIEKPTRPTPEVVVPPAPVVAPVVEPIVDPIVAPVSEPVVEPIVPVVAPVSEPAIVTPVETTVAPTESIVPSLENEFVDNLGDLDLIETVAEPETEVQIDRLPDSVVGQENPPVEPPPVEEPPVETPPVEPPVETPME